MYPPLRLANAANVLAYLSLLFQLNDSLNSSVVDSLDINLLSFTLNMLLRYCFENGIYIPPTANLSWITSHDFGYEKDFGVRHDRSFNRIVYISFPQPFSPIAAYYNP